MKLRVTIPSSGTPDQEAPTAARIARRLEVIYGPKVQVEIKKGNKWVEVEPAESALA
jgi:hypothetical protein